MFLLTRLLQVLDADVVHGEEGGRGSVLGTHVGDGGSVGDGQLAHARAEKLHKLPHHAYLAQVLQREDMGGGGTRGVPLFGILLGVLGSL